jgi:hypothetical protein
MSKPVKVAIWVGFAVMMGVGCNPISTAYFLFRGDSKNPAEHPLPPKEGKKEVTVAILVTAPNPSWEFAAVDRDLTAAIGRRLFDQTKEGKVPIKAVETAKLDKFKGTNPEWRSMSATEVGKQLGADYVLDLTLESVSLYEPGSGKYMYQGRATVSATVYDVAAGKQLGEPYFVNPKMDSRPADSMLMAQYKAKLMERIADEVTWKHVAHANDQQIVPPNN